MQWKVIEGKSECVGERWVEERCLHALNSRTFIIERRWLVMVVVVVAAFM